MVEFIANKFFREKKKKENQTFLKILHESQRKRHTLIIGTTGSGKSQLLMQLLDFLKMKRAQRNLIIDVKGEIGDHFGYFKPVLREKIEHLKNAANFLPELPLEEIRKYYEIKSAMEVTVSEFNEFKKTILNEDFEAYLKNYAVSGFINFSKRLDNIESGYVRKFDYDSERKDYLKAIPAEIEAFQELLDKNFADDQIFCPIEDRSVQWNIFNDIETLEDIQLFSYSAIPESTGKDAFWDNSARELVQSSIELLKYTVEKPTNKMLWEFINDIDKLSLFVAEPETIDVLVEKFGLPRNPFLKAKNYLASAGGDRVGSTISTMSVKLRFLELIKDMDGDFSFKKWAKSGQGSMFFPVPEDQINALMMLYRIPLEIVTKTMLGLPDLSSAKRTTKPLNLILDEFSGLGYLSTIIDAEARGRSKGLNVFIATQTVSDIIDIYGQDKADKMIDNINTKYFFKTPKSAEEVSKLIGKKTIIEKTRSMGFGTQDVRDGQNINEGGKKEVPLFTPTQIQNLPTRVYIGQTVDTQWWMGKVKYKRRMYINKAMDFKRNEVENDYDKITIEQLTILRKEIDGFYVDERNRKNKASKDGDDKYVKKEFEITEEFMQKINMQSVAPKIKDAEEETVIKINKSEIVTSLDDLFSMIETTTVTNEIADKEMEYTEIFEKNDSVKNDILQTIEDVTVGEEIEVPEGLFDEEEDVFEGFSDSSENYDEFNDIFPSDSDENQ